MLSEIAGRMSSRWWYFIVVAGLLRAAVLLASTAASAGDCHTMLFRQERGYDDSSLRWRRGFDGRHFSCGSSKAESQNPDAGKRVTINLRWLEFPAPCCLQSQIREVLAGTR